MGNQTEQPSQNNPRETIKTTASELQRGVAEKQAARWETALLILMRRTGDDVSLVNAMNGFLGALEHRSVLGDRSVSLSDSDKRALIAFFEQKTMELQNLTGNRESTT